MADINEIKKQEIGEIVDFYYFIQDYGHIFHENESVLAEPFKKIMEGISEVRKIIDNNYSA